MSGDGLGDYDGTTSSDDDIEVLVTRGDLARYRDTRDGTNTEAALSAIERRLPYCGWWPINRMIRGDIRGPIPALRAITPADLRRLVNRQTLHPNPDPVPLCSELVCCL
jgi:hypothetical protein